MDKFNGLGFPSEWSQVLSTIEIVLPHKPHFWGGCVRRLLSGEGFVGADCDIFFEESVTQSELFKLGRLLQVFFPGTKYRYITLYHIDSEIKVAKFSVPTVGDFDLVYEGAVRQSEFDFDVNSLCIDFASQHGHVKLIASVFGGVKGQRPDKGQGFVSPHVISLPEILRNIRERKATIVWAWNRYKIERSVLAHIIKRFEKLQQNGWTVNTCYSQQINLLFDKCNDDTCPLCLEGFDVADTAAAAASKPIIPIGLGCCLARFHCGCLTELLSSPMSASVTCPCCRVPIKPFPWFAGFSDFGSQQQVVVPPPRAPHRARLIYDHVGRRRSGSSTT